MEWKSWLDGASALGCPGDQMTRNFLVVDKATNMRFTTNLPCLHPAGGTSFPDHDRVAGGEKEGGHGQSTAGCNVRFGRGRKCGE